MDIGCAAEAENTLLGVGQDNTTPTDIALFYKETAPFVLLMLADIFKLSDRRKLAVACLKKCLDLNPFFWGAYRDLIDLRENVDPHEVFTLSTGLILNNHSCLRALSNKINIGDISHPNCPSKKRNDMHDSQEDLSVSRENVNPQYDENFNDPSENCDFRWVSGNISIFYRRIRWIGLDYRLCRGLPLIYILRCVALDGEG